MTTQKPARRSFKASVPAGRVAPEVWRAKRARSSATWSGPPKVQPLEPIDEPAFEPCRQEKCWMVTVHPRHDQDFARGKAPRPKPDYAERGRKISESRKRNVKQGYKEPYKVVRTEHRPNGPMLIVECEVCSGAGCDECLHLGEMPLFMWWQRRNQRR